MNFDDVSSTQQDWPAEMGSLGVSSALLLALPAVLTTAFGASDFRDDYLTNFRRCFVHKNASEMAHFDEWTGKFILWKPEKRDPNYLRQKSPRMTSRTDDKRSEVLNTHQG